MNILIFGHSGYLGSIFCEMLLKKNINFTKALSRADNFNDLNNEIKNNYTHVINFIGRTYGIIDGNYEYSATKFLSENLYINIKDNLYCHINIAIVCEKYNVHYTYIGTGCIYQNNIEDLINKNNPFNEESPPNYFNSEYSITKSFTESILKNMSGKILILRIRMAISDKMSNKNFLTKFINFKNINNIPNSFSVIDELFQHIPTLMKNNISGIINFVNPGIISPHEIVSLYKKYVDPDYIINPQTNIMNSSNCYLDTQLLQKLIPEVTNIKVSIIETLIKYKKNLNQLNT